MVVALERACHAFAKTALAETGRDVTGREVFQKLPAHVREEVRRAVSAAIDAYLKE